ncbi:MAG: hypothetical protein ACYTG0_12595 [Planctomycetota bacterium]|jgi:hypothetical protein
MRLELEFFSLDNDSPNVIRGSVADSALMRDSFIQGAQMTLSAMRIDEIEVRVVEDGRPFDLRIRLEARQLFIESKDGTTPLCVLPLTADAILVRRSPDA